MRTRRCYHGSFKERFSDPQSKMASAAQLVATEPMKDKPSVV
ncbi:protein of unknown function [Pararobbsia alpina]